METQSIRSNPTRGTSSPANVAFAAAALVPALVTAWVLWCAPLPDLAADRTAIAARDFTALWGAGQLALRHATALLSDPALFTQHLRDWFGPEMPDQIWPYPPPILLLGAPLAHLPLPVAFLLYSGVTLALLWGVLRCAGLPRWMPTVVLLSPAVAENLLIGQNGAITAACLAGGLLLVDSRPLVAGALFGALVIKPQMALLLPLCLLAGARWRAAGSAFGVSAALIGVCWACFGSEAWIDYLVTARPAIQAYFEAPWTSAGSQRIFASVFMAARSLGAGLPTAYAAQTVVALACAALAIRAWRQPDLEPRGRMAITVALTCLASPWVHSYDMVALAVAIITLAFDRPYWNQSGRSADQTKLDPSRRNYSQGDLSLALRGQPQHRPFLALAWLWPGVLTLMPIPTPLLVASTASVALLAWRNRRPAYQPLFAPIPCASPVSSS